jgi:hypothetical protein
MFGDAEATVLPRFGGAAVLVNGVSIEDRLVLQLAGLVGRRLGSKLVTAYRLRSPVLALTRSERDEILAALESAPSGLAELRGGLLREPT